MAGGLPHGRARNTILAKCLKIDTTRPLCEYEDSKHQFFDEAKFTCSGRGHTMVYRKSWTQYAKNMIGLIIRLAILIAFYMYYRAVFDIFLEIGLSITVSYWSTMAITVLLIFWVAKGIWHFFWLRSFRIEIDDHLVAVSHGLLPWTKYHRNWDADQVHECLFNAGGFFGWLVKSGELIIVGSEGSTHKYSFPGIGRVEEACGAINAMRRRGRYGR